MTDLVERLREAASLSLNEYGEADRYLEAADEIEKLRAQVVSLQSSLDAGPEHTRLGKKKTPDALEKP